MEEGAHRLGGGLGGVQLALSAHAHQGLVGALRHAASLRVADLVGHLPQTCTWAATLRCCYTVQMMTRGPFGISPTLTPKPLLYLPFLSDNRHINSQSLLLRDMPT